MRDIKIDGLDMPVNHRLRESIELLLQAERDRFFGSIELICENGQPVRAKRVESIKFER